MKAFDTHIKKERTKRERQKEREKKYSHMLITSTGRYRERGRRIWYFMH